MLNPAFQDTTEAVDDAAADDAVAESVTQSLVSPMTDSTEELFYTLEDWLMNLVNSGTLSPISTKLLVIVIMLALAALILLIARLIIVWAIRKVVVKTRTKWDDYLVARRFFSRLAHLAPAVVIYLYAPLFDNELQAYGSFLAGHGMVIIIERFAKCYMILVCILVGCSFVNAMADIYATLAVSRKNPIHGFIQGVKLVFWILGGILLAATISGREVWTLVAGIGAVMAVVLLVFRDTILGFVASIQIFLNDLVHIGDWIEMPAFGVDGDVTAITLTTIKVKNFDNTITSIPTYAVIAESFKNWRGMQESGGRRIKRAIFIDMSSVKFCSDEMIQRFKRFSLLSDYVQRKQAEVGEYNQQHGIDTSEIINGRRLTNLGTFRAYLHAYLARHEMIDQEMTFLVRQLAPSERGVPVQIYVFCRDTRWVQYEGIQADIFDHILAVIPEFELRLFQNPSGHDFARLKPR